MDQPERRALLQLRFNWAPTPEDMWRPPAAHVGALNDHAFNAVMAGFGDAECSAGPSPLSVVVVGQHGSGKTHLLSAAHQAVRDRGYFFPVNLLHAKDFWQSVVHGYC